VQKKKLCVQLEETKLSAAYRLYVENTPEEGILFFQ